MSTFRRCCIVTLQSVWSNLVMARTKVHVDKNIIMAICPRVKATMSQPGWNRVKRVASEEGRNAGIDGADSDVKPASL